ncbi:MAG: ATP phosphoribosyltransferase [Thermoleophilia bacterium]|nr:ATP phosphoribosyltransferase [Thermoleophilia bacterium]
MELKICVPLGALFEDAIAVLEAVGLPVDPLRDAGRRLIITVPGGPTYITTRPSDVPTYVESGAADLGIVGRDVLLERQPDVYELADLGFGKCRMAWCTAEGADSTAEVMERFGVVRVATKYVTCAERFFAATGRNAEIVKVNGSVELAPLVGLADGIVDLVATGRTLRENGLVERETIFESTARLIANRVSHKLHPSVIDDLMRRFEEVTR